MRKKPTSNNICKESWCETLRDQWAEQVSSLFQQLGAQQRMPPVTVQGICVLLCFAVHYYAPQGRACCAASGPLQLQDGSPRGFSSKVLPSTMGGQSNEEADKECMTFPSCRDCWDLLEGIQLVNEHSRAESGLELVINYKTSKGVYIGETHVCLRDGLRKREFAQQTHTEVKWRGAAGKAG